MPQTIFFQVGTKDHVSLSTFIDSLREFLGMLHDFDTVLSHDSRGNTDWEVSVLRKESPPLVGVIPSVRRINAPDVSAIVGPQLIENTNLLNATGERNEFMPDAALYKLKAMATRAKRIGPMAIYLNGEQREHVKTQINQATLRNVRELTDVKYTGYGSIRGKLESISVHRGNEFRVWDAASGKPVRCKFTLDMEQRVKDCLRSIVLVSGEIESNSAGLPIAMTVDNLDVAASDADLPTLEHISGLVDDFTEGKSLKEYIEDISNE